MAENKAENKEENEIPVLMVPVPMDMVKCMLNSLDMGMSFIIASYPRFSKMGRKVLAHDVETLCQMKGIITDQLEKMKREAGERA